MVAIADPQKIPLHRQLYEELRRSILTGQLLPGQRLPSTRGMARSLGISRTTVTQSYEQLQSEGYLQTISGSGTFVCKQLPEDLLRAAPVQSVLEVNPAAKLSIQLSAYGASLADNEPFEPPVPGSPIRFKYGQPDLDRLPLKQWRKLWSRHCRVGHHAVLDYAPDSQGYQPLREAIARYLARSRSVQCDADQVLIVNGFWQGLDLIVRVLVERGDRVALEEPSCLDTRRMVLAQGAKLWPIPVDESGMMVERLPDGAGEIKLVYVTPSHQFPTGVTLSLPRRLELLAWARASGAIVIEDDYDSEYRYSGRPTPALQGLDRHNVIYVGGFTEALFPALCVGYLVVPQPLMHVLARAKWLADRQSPLLEQHVLTDFMNEGHLERHMRRMRSLYEQRRQTLVQALILHLGERVTILGDNAGMHLTVRLHTSLSDEEVISRAAQVGVGLGNTRPYYLGSGCPGEFLLGYADLSELKIAEGISRLAQVLLDG